MSSEPAWLEALQQPQAYPHPVTKIELLQTHISWVLLTGDWVYKLKKPVNLGFVDFTSLEQRHAACLEEIRLNRRTAPELYDDLFILKQAASGYQFCRQSDQVVEYAVRMRQFPQENLLAHRLERGDLSISQIEQLARNVADLHLRAAVADRQTQFGESELILSTVQACLDQISRSELPEALQHYCAPLTAWVQQEWLQRRPVFQQRKQDGFVRECHGDLHLGNLVFVEGNPTLFDCLEFNPGLRWIDIISDIGFLMMDLLDRKATGLAWRCLNEWLEQTGDYAGLSVLKFYLTYRALVRAKVAAIRLEQSDLAGAARTEQLGLLESYLQLSSTLTQKGLAGIILMHGVSGSGKSYVARELVTCLNGIQVRSDVERKRLMGLWPPSSDLPSAGAEVSSKGNYAQGLYTADLSDRTYQRLRELAQTIVAAGYVAIIDAAFLDQMHRTAFVQLAHEVTVPLVIVDCNAPQSVLEQRIIRRQMGGRDASDASVEILRQQLKLREPLTLSEQARTVSLATDVSELLSIVPAIRARLEMNL